MSSSADLSFQAVVLARKLLPAPALAAALRQAEARGVPLGRQLVESGALSADAVRQVEGIRARWGRSCGACRATTYLLPGRSEADTPCEACGGELKRPAASPAAPAPGRARTPTPGRGAPRPRTPTPARPAPRRPAAPPPEPAPALVEEEEDEGPPLPAQVGQVAIESLQGEDASLVVYEGRLGEEPVLVRLLRPERAERWREVDAFWQAASGAPASGLEPVDLGHDALGAPFLAVRRSDAARDALLALRPPSPAAPEKDADKNASSDTGTLIFTRLQQQREVLLKEVAAASRRRERCVGRFVLLEQLASDAGELWRGFDSDSNEVVAVRVLACALERVPADLEGQLAAAARPRHAGVLPLREWGLEDGRLFLVREHLSASQPLGTRSLEATVRQLHQAAQALAYLHGLGQAHGGLHPGSLVHRGDDAPLLIDLGAAAACTACGPAPMAWRLARAGCASPEAADGRADDVPGDVHALGALLLRAAAAWLPERLPPPVVAPAPAPAPEPALDLLAIALRCLERDPAERYPSALELARELERVTQGQLSQARQPRAPADEAVKPPSVVATLSGVFKRLLGRE